MWFLLKLISTLITKKWIKITNLLYKFRFIAGATNCTTKTLSVQLSLALKLIKNHFQNYCNKIAKLNGYCMHWSIDNSSECMNKIKNVNAHSVYTFDFSTLYTNLTLIDIHDKLTKLIKKMYQNANAHYILVNTYTGKAFWSRTNKCSYKSFSLQHLFDALKFILNNTSNLDSSCFCKPKVSLWAAMEAH